MSQITDKAPENQPNKLIPLKILIFLFFGALQCLYAYLPNHMHYLGFSLDEVRTVTLIASLVSIIGPLIVGFILDRISLKTPSNYGKWLRILLFVSFIASGIFFGLLLFVPAAKPLSEDHYIGFSCDANGGHLYERPNGEVCRSFSDETGDLHVTKCKYVCEIADTFSEVENFKDNVSGLASERLQSNDTSLESPSDEDYIEESLPTAESLVQKSSTAASSTIRSDPLVPPPHICLNTKSNIHCHVYLENTVINIKDVHTIEGSQDEANDVWCMHPLDGFSCNVPEAKVEYMKETRKETRNITGCEPKIECSVIDQNIVPYNEPVIPYNWYYPLRIIAELFPIIIHMLLNIAIVIATRETSLGRGNIGHQWAFYPIGVLIFASILGVINHGIGCEQYLIPMIVFPVTMFLCAIIVLFAGKLPLTPSDWWWHTKCGMLAIPMSALKRYKWVIFSIALTAFILGGLWHVQEAFRHLFSVDIIEDLIMEYNAWRSKTFVYVIGALIAIPIIWNGEKVVDTLGHSNIFILAFISFALRFGGLYFDSKSPWSSFYELFEPISFYLAWFALFLFIRHLVPKRFLALGQGLLVILFFALGRSIGFFFGVSIEPVGKFVKTQNDEEISAIIADLENIHSTATVIAFFAALLYFIIYHLILLPRYHVPTNRLATNNDSNVSPQRVFHDERSRKGYFKY